MYEYVSNLRDELNASPHGIGKNDQYFESSLRGVRGYREFYKGPIVAKHCSQLRIIRFLVIALCLVCSTRPTYSAGEILNTNEIDEVRKQNGTVHFMDMV